MKRVILMFFAFVVVLNSYGQEESKRNFNFIILIDGNVPFQGDINLQFVIENKKLDTIRVGYIPGDIVLEESGHSKIISIETKSINLEIYYSRMFENKIKSYNYKIDFKQSWFKNPFNILRIYNLDNKKNKKTFIPIDGLKYIYEIDSPNGSIIRLKKKN